MPVRRITRQIDLDKSDSIILIYGQVNDIFVTGDLAFFKGDGIEKILSRYLRDKGYEQIIFYAPERQLYVYDTQSYSYCFPDTDKPPSIATDNAQTPSGNNGRPLGSKKYLRQRNQNARTQTAFSHAGSVMNEPVWHREGFIPVVRGGSDNAVIDIIRATLFSERQTAVIFSQFDSTNAISEIQRQIIPLIGRLLRTATENKCIFITNAVNQEKLRELVDAVPALSQIVSMGNSEKGLDSVIYIDYPGKDEIRNLIHRQRIMEGKQINWLQLDKIVNGLDTERNQLKKWERDFRNLRQFDIESVNRVLPHPFLTEGDASAWRRLDDLTGLIEVKNTLRRYFHHIRDLRESNASEAPLMHIVLKGNPGTGKTTLARIIAQIFREEGLLERGHLIEADRERLVAGFIGQTAIKTDACCREALDGVLFIDEAYALAPRENSNNSNGGTQDFGKEAVDTLIKRMTDWQNRLVVILAGYPEDMNRLLVSNPGFSGRIGLYLEIEDYSPEELTDIFNIRATRARRTLTPQLNESVQNIFTNIYKKRGKKFDNARIVEQVYSKISGQHAERCAVQNLRPLEEPFETVDIPDEYKNRGWDLKTSADGTALDRLNALIGLAKAKEQIRRQVALVQAGKGAPGYDTGRRLHLIFKGNPGTGKTTVARLVGEIYQDYQILPNNVFIEVSRKDLVAEFQGATTRKVEEKCREALGGILFIDEVYSLVNGENDTFGKEAIDALITIMENERERLCVIVAGYPHKMHDFLDSNPGLKRRFGGEIEFTDYNVEQLLLIFKHALNGKNLVLAEGVLEKVTAILKTIYERRDENFGNAGEVENILQQIQQEHAFRCFNAGLNVSEEPIREADMPNTLIELLPVLNADEIIEEATKELDEMVGLESVKKFIGDLVIEYKHEREALKRNPNLRYGQRNYHLIFEGNPGTGKTTVARIMGKIFKALDILKQGKVIETQRPDFVAGYQGQTAEKTRKLIKGTLDNILFIDEAYSLNQGMMDSFGVEAIDTLLKMMEDHRNRLVVIAAGYPRNMRMFLLTNPGLSSRFPRRIQFEDYSTDDLVQVFKYQVQKRGFLLSENLDKEFKRQITLLKARKKDFGNAREVENFLDAVVLPNYRRRAIHLQGEEFWTITKDDFPEYNPDGTEINDQSKSHKEDFSMAKDKKAKQKKAVSIEHAGPGDIVMGNQTVNNYNFDKDSVLPENLTQLPKISSIKIVGRDAFIAHVFEQLISPKSPGNVVVHGIGGIGKTTVLKKFLETYKDSFGHFTWIEHSGSLIKSLIENKDLVKNLQIRFQDQDDEMRRFELVKDALHKLGKNCLIIVDNILESDLPTILTLSASPKIKILMSCRQPMGKDHIIDIRLQQLEAPEALRLFQEYYEEPVETSATTELFKRVSFHPLAIEIIAKILKRHPRLTIGEMLTTIQEHGLHFRKGKIDLDYGPKMNPDDEVLEIFTYAFQIFDLNESEKEYLRYFSVLPPYPIQFEMLAELFEKTNDQQQLEDALTELVDKSLIVFEKERGYYAHQIIQEVCRAELQPKRDNIKPLLENFGFRLGEKIDGAVATKGIYPLIGEYLSMLEYFRQYIDDAILVEFRVLINMSVLYRVNGQFNESVAISNAELVTLEQEKEQKPILYNIIKRNIAFAHSHSGNNAEAEKHYLEGVEFLASIRNLEQHPLREFIEKEMVLDYSQLGILQLRVESFNLPQAIHFFESGFKIASNAENIDPIAIASLKEGMALAQLEQGDHEDALASLNDARKIMMENMGMDESSLPVGLIDLSRAIAFSGLGDFGNAEMYCNEAINAMKNHLPDDSIEFSRAYAVAAIIKLQNALSEVQEFDDFSNLEEKNLKLLEIAGREMKKSVDTLILYRGENHEDLAFLYSTLGFIYKLCGRDDDGLRYHEKGVQIYEKGNYKNLLIASLYFRTVLFFNDKMQYSESKNYLKRCIEAVPADLPDRPLAVSFVNYCIGQLARERKEDLREAIVYIDEALDGVRKFEGKNSDVGSDRDSPFEVICLQEIALIHDELGEFTNALKRQKEAVDICMRHMDQSDPELAPPLASLAYLYKKNSEKNNEPKMLAQALEFKVKAEEIDRDVVRKNENLNDCGRLYSIKEKKREGKDAFHLIVMSDEQKERYKNDRSAGAVTELKAYGFIVYTETDFNAFIEKIDVYTEKYGQWDEEFMRE